MVLGVALLFSACAQVRPYTCPSLDRERWWSVETDHFTLYSQLPLEQSRELGTCLERAWVYLSALAFRSAKPPTDRALVVAIKQQSQLRKALPESAIGSFHVEPLEERPTLLLYGDSTEDACQIAQHEIAHRFLHHFTSSAPRWLDEGMAQFWAFLAVDDDGQATIGDPNTGPGTNGPIDDGADSTARLLLALSMPTFAALTSADPRTFYGGDVRANYLAAQELVRVLYMPKYQSAFGRYLSKLGGVATAQRAWEELLEEVGAAELKHDYVLAIHPASRRPAWRVQTTPVPWVQAPMRVVTLDELRVHRLYAELYAGAWGVDRAQALEHTRAMRTHEPTSVDARVLELAVARARGDLVGVEAAARELADGGLADPRAASMLFEQAVEEQLAFPGEQRDWAQAERIAEAFRKRAHTARALNMLGWYYAQRNQPLVGASFARRSVEKDPTCWECLDTLALLQFQLGNARAAAETQTRAINVLSSGRVPRDLLYRLSRYQTQTATVAR